MIIEKIVNLTDISTGFQVRNKLTAEDKGSHRLIQMRNINEQNGEIKTDNGAIFYEVSPNNAFKYELKLGDILLLTRGRYNPATLIGENEIGFVAAGQFSVLRIRSKNCLPEYLHWYLNQQKVQNNLKRVQGGTNIPILTKDIIMDLNIELPDPKIQKKIIKINRQANKEHKLMNQLMKKKQELVRGLCNQLIQNR